MRLLALLLVAGCAREAPTGGHPQVEVPTLTMDAVAELLEKPDIFLFDANPRDFYEHGHLPGARWVQFNDVTAALPADHDATLIFYCANQLCTASHDAARAAISHGYRHVYVMPDGFIGWKKSARPIVRPDAG